MRSHGPGEIFNSVTHLVGSVFAVVGFAGLLVSAVPTGDPWKITSFAVYGAALVARSLISTLYHGVRGRPKRIFESSTTRAFLVDEKYAHSHGIFHLFVLGGSVLHFFAVLLFVA